MLLGHHHLIPATTFLVVLLFSKPVQSHPYFPHLPQNRVPPYTVETSTTNGSFNWSSITPSTDLYYHPCYTDYQCARLLVPLSPEHHNLTTHNVSVAITLLPATVPRSDPSFAGTILLNPGGPSGSGTDSIRWNGVAIQNIVSSDERKFEILGFDPRGVGNTEPKATCFEGEEARDAYEARRLVAGGVDGRAGLDVKWALANGLGKLCEGKKVGEGEYDIRRYVTTKLVAGDMVAIIDAVEKKKQRSLKNQRIGDGQQKVFGHKKKSGRPLLNFIGYSYGTYLGNTFASLYPDRIGRMILDGNVDANDYAATGWTTNLHDNNLVWRTFFKWCFDAGQRCALHDPSLTSSLEMHAKVITLFDTIKHNPIPYIDPATNKLDVLTYFAVQYTMHPYAYYPWHSWPKLARNLASLLDGDPLLFLNLAPSTPTPNTTLSTATGPPFILQSDLSPTPGSDTRFLNRTNPYPPSYPHALEAAASILCGDGTPLHDPTKPAFSSYVSDLTAQSPLIGPTWADITLPCRHWPSTLRPSDSNRFIGPFGSKLKDYDGSVHDKKGGWARPLLFVGNKADPVTPVGNARRMSESHEGSRVLEVGGPGHCATGGNVPSECVWGAVRRFMAEGRLPEVGVGCEVDWKPWDRVVGGGGGGGGGGA